MDEDFNDYPDIDQDELLGNEEYGGDGLDEYDQQGYPPDLDGADNQPPLQNQGGAARGDEEFYNAALAAPFNGNGAVSRCVWGLWTGERLVSLTGSMDPSPQ
jgi:hypothetical protein